MPQVINQPSPLNVGKRLSWVMIVLRVIFVLVLHGINLLFWYVLTPRVFDMYDSMNAKLSPVVLNWFNAWNFCTDHRRLCLRGFIGLAAIHIWAICQKNRKGRMVAWAIAILFMLFFTGIFIYYFSISPMDGSRTVPHDLPLRP
jgi:hypothetical protein